MNLIKKGIAVGVAALMVLGPTAASAATMADLQAMLASLQAQLASMQQQQHTVTGDVATQPTEVANAGCTFTSDLYLGSRGEAVTCLQQYLVEAGDLKVSPTGFFGNATKAAVAGKKLTISIDKDSPYSTACDSLNHELSHCIAFLNKKDYEHSDYWGKIYAKVYRAYLDL